MYPYIFLDIHVLWFRFGYRSRCSFSYRIHTYRNYMSVRVCVCGCTYACNICMRYMHLFNYSLLMGSSHSFPDLESTNRCKIRAWNPNASASSSPWFHGVLFTKFQALHPIPLSPAWMCIPLRQWIEFLMFKWTVTILMNHELTEVHIQVCIHIYIYCIYCIYIYIVCIYIYMNLIV